MTWEGGPAIEMIRRLVQDVITVRDQDSNNHWAVLLGGCSNSGISLDYTLDRIWRRTEEPYKQGFSIF